MRKACLAIFLLVAVACGNRSPASGSADSGIRGRVVAGPQCPVEPAGGSECADKPVSTDVKVKNSGGGAVTTVQTGSDGRFEVRLGPGTYVLEPADSGDGGFMFAKPVSVTVEPHRFARVTVILDTGIR
jgi:hypothetical protein